MLTQFGGAGINGQEWLLGGRGNLTCDGPSLMLAFLILGAYAWLDSGFARAGLVLGEFTLFTVTLHCFSCFRFWAPSLQLFIFVGCRPVTYQVRYEVEDLRLNWNQMVEHS